MAQLVAIDNKNHLQLAIDQTKVEQHGAKLHLVPAVVPEFSNMAVQYPLVITKNGDTGQFVFAAMLGFEAGENLYWRDEQWQGLYVPLQIRRQPFFVAKSTASDNYDVCYDTDSPAVATEHGQRLFNDQGQETEFFAQAKGCLGELLRGEEANSQLLSYLQEMDLLQSMKMEVMFANQQTMNLSGLYTVDQDKLAALSAEQVTQLHQAGLLAAVYTLVISLGQMHQLIDLKNKQLGHS